jgi:monofunctional biosynthetic peptidoglycan transglycosylase
VEEPNLQNASEPAGRLRSAAERVLRVIKANPIKSLLIAFAAFVAVELISLPYEDISKLRYKNPAETAFMRERADQLRVQGRRFRKMQIWIPLKEIPSDAVDAVVVAEDGTFWSNEGFDWFEFKESLERDLDEGRAARGASTITQQLVKNLYLSSSKSVLRKLKEWVLTWYMNEELTKPRILEIYLNVIEWGDNVYGIGAASQYYFGKAVSALTREECARLAAIIPSPRRHRADGDSRYVQRRSRMILDRMDARGM